MAVSTLTPLAFASPRELTKAYLRLTASITPTAGGILGGVWAPEATGYNNTIAQIGSQPALTLIAGRHYCLEMYPYMTGADAAEYDFWNWTTTSGAVLPATAMGGMAYGPAGREEMGATIKAMILPTVNTDVCIWTHTVAGTVALEGESISRSTSIFVYEIPTRAF
jgi:hypothetical protein